MFILFLSILFINHLPILFCDTNFEITPEPPEATKISSLLFKCDNNHCGRTVHVGTIISCMANGIPKPTINIDLISVDDIPRMQRSVFKHDTHSNITIGDLRSNEIKVSNAYVNKLVEVTCSAKNIRGEFKDSILVAVLASQRITSITFLCDNKICSKSIRVGTSVSCSANGFPEPTISITINLADVMRKRRIMHSHFSYQYRKRDLTSKAIVTVPNEYANRRVEARCVAKNELEEVPQSLFFIVENGVILRSNAIGFVMLDIVIIIVSMIHINSFTF